MYLKIVELGIRLGILIMAGIVVPAFRRWLDEKTEVHQKEKILMWVNSAVNAAEQIHKKVEKDDPHGTLRKKYAREMVSRLCLNSGIVITDKELDMLIEAAVNTINYIGGHSAGEPLPETVETSEE